MDTGLLSIQKLMHRNIKLNINLVMQKICYAKWFQWPTGGRKAYDMKDTWKIFNSIPRSSTKSVSDKVSDSMEIPNKDP